MKAKPHRNCAQTQSGAISSGIGKSNWVRNFSNSSIRAGAQHVVVALVDEEGAGHPAQQEKPEVSQPRQRSQKQQVRSHPLPPMRRRSCSARRRATSFFSPSSQLSTPASVIRWTRLRSPPITSPDTSLATIQSHPLRCSFRLRNVLPRPPSRPRSRPAARGRRGLRARSAEDVGIGQPVERRRPGRLLQLGRGGLDPPVGDRGDQDGGVGRQSAARRRPPSRGPSRRRPARLRPEWRAPPARPPG